MKFSEMPYERIDLDALGAEFDALTEKVKNAKSGAEVLEAFREQERLNVHAQTMVSIASVRNSIDTRDEFYEAEREFYDTNLPAFEEHSQNLMLAVFESPYRDEVEKVTGSLMFKNLEMDLKTFSPEVIEQLGRENKLVSDYAKLIASAKIDFDGKQLNISQLAAYKQNPDREVRHAAYKAESGFYMSHADELDDIFDELVKVRTEIARKLGFKNFTELAYLRRTRNCYDPEMVANFRRQVVSDLVPIVRELKRRQAERIGLTPADMRIYDDVFSFREGNPKPMGTPDDIMAAGKRMYEEMSPETGEFINFMYDNELLDVLAKEGKRVGGYCTDFPEYKAPFIFSNFNGTSGDVDVLTHEAGHAFAGYTTRNFEFMENAQPTMESCECHSMSMEFFAWKWLNLFYGDDTDRAKYMHLESALIFIPYGCMVDHFQHIVYDNPDMTKAERHEAWLKLEAEYRPYMQFGDVDFYASGRGWQRQLHIYHYPFYYIDYCLAQTVSLEFWSMSQKDYADAWERYYKFVCEGGRKTFVGLCEAADIRIPFESGALKEIAGTAVEWLK
ncbi:MAG: M3 family oligoendopeptidase [Clostridia bacterium]|nr:M3 family oligoendopeptidase [Clostridia bacterium]